MINSTLTHAQELLDKLNDYDKLRQEAAENIDSAIELTKEGLAAEADVVQTAAENLVFASSVVASNIDVLELVFGQEVTEDLFPAMPDLNRDLLQEFFTRLFQAAHLSQLIGVIYDAVVEPLERLDNGDLKLPGDSPTEAVEKILATLGKVNTTVDL